MCPFPIPYPSIDVTSSSAPLPATTTSVVGAIIGAAIGAAIGGTVETQNPPPEVLPMPTLVPDSGDSFSMNIINIGIGAVAGAAAGIPLADPASTDIASVIAENNRQTEAAAAASALEADRNIAITKIVDQIK